MQTKVILSAEDRGLSSLFRRLGGETDAFISKFQQLGTVLAGAMSTFGTGFSVRQALKWADEFEQSIFSIAVTLSDTVKGADMSKVFDQNARHAEAMFRVLQREAGRSIATVAELRRAYQVFAATGLALAPTEKSASSLSALVSRIRLATIGQDPNLQIAQEMRGLLEGRNRADSVLSRIFIMRDPNYQATVKDLVRKGSGQEVIDYLSGLISDIDLSGKVGRLLSVSLSQVQDSVRMWAIDAFRPLKDGVVDALGAVNEVLNDPESPLMKGLERATATIQSMFQALVRWGGKFMNSGLGRYVAEFGPQIVALTAGVTALSTALAALKFAGGALMTIPGMALAGYAGYQAISSRANSGPGSNGDILSLKEGRYDWQNGIKVACESVVDAMGFLKAAYTESYESGAVGAVGGILLGAVQTAGGTLLTGLTAILGPGVAKLLEFGATALAKVSEWGSLLTNAIDWLVSEVLKIFTLLREAPDLFFDWLATELHSLFADILGFLDRMAKDVSARLAYFADEAVLAITRALGGLPIVGSRLQTASDNIWARRSAERGLSEDNSWTGSLHRAAMDEAERRRAALDASLAEFRALGDSLSEGMEAARVDPKIQSLLDKARDYSASFDGESVIGNLIEVGRESADAGFQLLRESWSDYLAAFRSPAHLESDRTEPIRRSAKRDGEGSAEAITRASTAGDEDVEARVSTAKSLVEYLREQATLSRGVSEYRADALSVDVRLEELAARRVTLEQEIADLQKDQSGFSDRLPDAQRGVADALDRQVAALLRKQEIYSVIEGLEQKGLGVGAGFLSGMVKYAGDGVTAMKGAEEVINGIAEGLETTFSDLFLDALRGDLDSFADYFAQWGNLILQTFAQVVAQMLVKWAVLKMVTGVVSMFAAPSVPAGSYTGDVNISPSVAAMAANGAVWKGGFTPFADGGVVSGPTLGLVGEGRYNEAVVPLPDGRRIPVDLRGGAPSVTVNVNDSTGLDIRKTVNARQDEDGQTIIDIILDAAQRNRGGFGTRLRGALGMGPA
jgi:hypothetical protein